MIAASSLASCLACLGVLAAQQGVPFPPPAEPADRVVATVGNVALTAREVRAEMNALLPLTYYHARVPPDKVTGFRAQAVAKLIEKTRIHLDAVERRIPVREPEIRAKFRETLAQAGPRYASVPPAEFDRLLAVYRPRVIRRILVDKNEARNAATAPEVGEADVRALYEKTKEGLRTPAEAHLQHILVKVDPTASQPQIEAARARIAAARKQIVAGRPFEEVAPLYSDDIYAKQGGDLGFVRQGSFLRGRVDRAAFALREGELSGVLTSIYGFHLVRCVEVRPRRQLRFDEVRARLRRQLVEARRKQTRDAWMARLARRYPSEVDEAALDRALPVPSRPASRPATPPVKRRR